MWLSFDGNPKNYKEWIKSVEKYATLINVPEARKKLIAYQSSGGAVSGFIHRYMQANPVNTRGQLKEQLAVRVSDVTDPQMALSMLRSVKQKHITKTCLVKYNENFTTKKWKFSDKKILIFFIFVLKT